MKTYYLVKNYYMDHLSAFKGQDVLIKKFGVGKAHLLWVMGIYLDDSNLEELASECLTDGSDDKKIDFIKLDYDNKKIVFAQGYYTDKNMDSAPANKASDLNTAGAWLLSGDPSVVPTQLSQIIQDCRRAIEAGDIEKIELLYVHDLPESVNVNKELKTAAEHLFAALPKDKNVFVIARELGLREVEVLYSESSSQIVISGNIPCPAKIEFTEKGSDWEAYILSVPGSWLRNLYTTHGDKLFSANYRGFLGISKRRRKNINSDIKNTAETQPGNFWVFNNGITILTSNCTQDKDGVILSGISIINGAQTTGSISMLDASLNLNNLKVLTRVIKCTNPDTISEIIKFNNTQNEITSWDKFSNDPIQKMIKEKLHELGHSYNIKRGFTGSTGQIGIENVIQPLASLAGLYKEANRGKNGLFLTEASYKIAFDKTNPRHILFAYCLNQAIDEIRINLKKKKDDDTIIDIEERQLQLLRNLRFKNFFIAVFGKCIDVLLSKKVTNIKEVCFSPEASKAQKNSLEALIVELYDVVNFVLIYMIPNIQDWQQTFDDENALALVSSGVSAMMYASLATSKNKTIDDFRKIMSIGQHN
jgi:AIPR protein